MNVSKWSLLALCVPGCVSMSDTETGRAALQPDAGVWGEGDVRVLWLGDELPAPEEVGGDFGRSLEVRLLELEPDCDETRAELPPECLRDEQGGRVAWTLTTNWQDFESAQFSAQSPLGAYGAVVTTGGVVALVDSPLPGPADAVAVGVIVVGSAVVTVQIGWRFANETGALDRIAGLLARSRTAVARGVERVVSRARGRAMPCTSSPGECCPDFLTEFGDRLDAVRNGYMVRRDARPGSRVLCCLEWDRMHGDFEIFGRRGEHRGGHTCNDLSDPCTNTQGSGSHNLPDDSGRHRPRAGCLGF